MASRVEQLKKSEAQVKTLIEANKGYEALRLITTISGRYEKLKAADEALRFMFECAQTLLTQKDYNVGIQVATQYTSTMTNSDVPFTQLCTTQLTTLFGLFPTPELGTDGSYMYKIDAHAKFFNAIISHLKKQIQKAEMNINELYSYENTLHTTYALFLYKHNLIDQATIHFILATQHDYTKTDVAVQHALLIFTKVTTLPRVEQGIATLRLVLMYLCSLTPKQTTTTTTDLFKPVEAFLKALQTKFGDALTTQPFAVYFSCAQGLITMAKLGHSSADNAAAKKVYNKFCDVYEEILDESREEKLHTLLQKVGEKFCGIPAPKKSFLDGLFA